MARTWNVRTLVYSAVLASLIASACAGGGAQAPAPTSGAAAAPTTAAAPPPAPTAASTNADAAQTVVAMDAAAADATAAAVAAAPAATTAPAATEAPPTVEGSEIRIASTEPPNMDPGRTSDSASIQVIMHIFEGLVAQDAEGNIKPAVAESWEVSDDGLTYTFHLRDTAKWSDGKPVTAHDFEWAWKRNIDAATASDYATSLYPVKNAKKVNTGELDKEQLGIDATDDRTLVVTLEQPAAYFLSLSATWTLMPLRQDTVEPNGDRWVEAENILTNGPYTLTEWVHDQQIVLKVDPNYWGPKPQIQTAIFRIFPDGGEDQALAAYESGELDTIGTNMTIPAAQVDRVKADPTLGYHTFDESATYFLTVNNRREHLSDPRVRKALGMSLDRESIIRDVIKTPALPAYTLQAIGIAGRDPELWVKEDVEAAKQMLADAGFPDGKGMPTLRYAYNTNDGHKRIAEYLQQRWKEALNLDIEITNMEWSVFLKFRDTEDWTANGDIFRGGWFSDYEDPNNWFNLLWASDSDPQQFNSGWKSEQYDTLVQQAAGESDPEKRAAMYLEAEKVLAEAYPNIPVYHYGGQTLTRSYVKGMVPSRILQVVPLETMSIEPH